MKKQDQWLLESLKMNLQIDYPQQLQKKCIDNVISVIAAVLQQKTIQQRESKLQQLLKKQFDKQAQAIKWLKNSQRLCKYSDDLIIKPSTSTSKSQVPDLLLCQTSDSLVSSVKKNQLGYATFQTNYQHIETDGVSYMIQENKKYLFQKRRGIQAQTEWMFEMTQDKRYVWRGSIMLDILSLTKLLYFIFRKRNKQQTDDCPSVCINSGSHGDAQGKNAEQSGNPDQTAPWIYNETLQSIFILMSFDYQKYQQLGLRLNRNNLQSKIFVNRLSSASRCIYPIRADHIIDVQCRGAYTKISKTVLYPVNSQYKNSAKDLMFLSPKQQQPNQKIIPNPNNLKPQKIIIDNKESNFTFGCGSKCDFVEKIKLVQFEYIDDSINSNKKCGYNQAIYRVQGLGNAEFNVFIADYMPFQNTFTIDQNCQFGIDSGTIFLVIHRQSQRKKRIYKWRFIKAADGLTKTKSIANQTNEGLKFFFQNYGLSQQFSFMPDNDLKQFKY